MAKTEKSDKKRIFTITKADDDKMQVFGWASTAKRRDGSQVVDHEGDTLTPDELERSAYEYVLNFRDTGERHDPSKRMKGKLIESCVFTKEKQAAMGIPDGIVPEAWWVGFQMTDKDAWAKIKSGEYQMFSIEGSALREPVRAPEEPRGIAKSFSEIIAKYKREGSRVNGCGVLVVKDGKVLSGTRIGGMHDGKICGPGGHIEPGEEPEEAAIRETQEEFGITCKGIRELGMQDGGRAYGKSIVFICTDYEGEPKVDEDEMTDLKWRTVAELKQKKLFKPFEQSLSFLSTAKSFSEVMRLRKFNPFHDERGRFSSANGMKTFSANPDTRAGQIAIERAKASGNALINSHPNAKDKSENQTNNFQARIYDAKTGKEVKTEVVKVTPEDLKAYTKESGWYAPWAEMPGKWDIKAIKTEDGEIQGLVGYHDVYYPQTGYKAIRGEWAVSNPQNRGQDKKYEGIGKNLFAIMCQESFDRGYEGKVEGEAYNRKVLTHYINKFGATEGLWGEFLIKTEAANKIISDVKNG